MALDRSRRHVIALLALMALTIFCYGPVREAGLVWEDARPSSPHWALLTFTPRALTSASMVWQAKQSVSALHLVNLGLHLLNGLLLYGLLRSVNASTRFWLVGLWWLHPIQTEAVSYIAARADLLLVTSVLLLLWATKLPAIIDELVMLACLWLAVAAKETGVVAVGLLALWCLARRQRLPHVITVSVIGALIISGHFLSHLHAWTAQAPPIARFVGVQIAGLWRLFALLIVPYGFTVAHQWTAIPSSLAIVAAIGTVLVCIGAWHGRARYPAPAFAVAWIVIACAPRVLIPVPHPLTEHQLALPMLGLWLTPLIGR